jgi:hypothetical protein
MYLLEPDLFNTINFVSSGVHTISRQLISLPNCFFHFMLNTDIVCLDFYYFVLFRGVIGEEVCFRPILLSRCVMGEEVYVFGLSFCPLVSWGRKFVFACPVVSWGGHFVFDLSCFVVSWRRYFVSGLSSCPVVSWRRHFVFGLSFCPVVSWRRHFVFGLSSCPRSLYPQLLLHFGWEFLTIDLNYSWSDIFWRSYCPFTLKIFHQKVFFTYKSSWNLNGNSWKLGMLAYYYIKIWLSLHHFDWIIFAGE